MTSGRVTVAAVTGAESEPSELILKLVMVPASAVYTNSVGNEGGGGVPGVVGEGEGVGFDAVVCDPPHPARTHTARINTHAVILEVVIGSSGPGEAVAGKDAADGIAAA